MTETILGDFTFNTGWKKTQSIVYFKHNYSVVIKLKAYYEADGITEAQKQAWSLFKKHESKVLAQVEQLLLDAYGQNAAQRFIPKTVLFNRDGSYAVLCDDTEDMESGIAVCLEPEATIMSQDDYL